jgi:hypothetical protein
MLRAENACQRLRAARAAIQGDTADLSDGLLSDDQQAANAIFRSDGEIRQDGQIADALIFDGGNDGNIRRTAAKRFSAKRWHRERQLVLAAERAVGKAPDQRSGVEVLHDGDAKFRQICNSLAETKVYRKLRAGAQSC